MIARIHHVKNGIEYVLQFNCKDTIELRIIKHTLLGRFPNYFRHEWGTSCYEMDIFQEALRNSRPYINFLQVHLPHRIPRTTNEERDLIHAFEKIAGINLMLTPESVRKRRLESMRELACLPGIDISATVSYASVLQSLRRSNEQTPTEEEPVQNAIPRMPEALEEQLTHTPESLRAANPDMNTAGLTEEQVEENLEFVARLLNGETIPASEAPLRNPDNNDDDIDGFLKEVDEVLENTPQDSDEVCGAPAHRLEIPAPVMTQLWKQAKDQD